MIRRNTIQRTLTLEAVQALTCHPTAEEVYRKITLDNPSISRATVYRNLKQLAANGMLLRVTTTDGADHFDHRCDYHYHARCIQCGRVFDIELDVLPNPLASIQETYGFHVYDFDLIFKGLCTDCMKGSLTCNQL